MIRIQDEVHATHPSIPGHFPGNPIVPGALLLVRVLRAAAKVAKGPVCGVSAVKFLAPLKPGEKFEMVFGGLASGATMQFQVLRGNMPIASGTICVQTDRQKNNE